MTVISVYHRASGRIERVVNCAPADVGLQYDHQTHGHAEGAWPDTYFYVQPDGAVAPMPERPSEHHVFDYDTKTWADPRTMDDHKSERWTFIKRARDQAEFSTFTWDGSVFDSDRTSQSRIQGAAQLAQIALAAGQPFSIDWTLADNTVRTLTASDMLQVGMAMGQHINECHERGRQRRQAIMDAQSIEQVNAVVW